MRTANQHHRRMYDTFEDPKATEDKEKAMVHDWGSKPYLVEHWNSTKPEAKMAIEESRAQKIVTSRNGRGCTRIGPLKNAREVTLLYCRRGLALGGWTFQRQEYQHYLHTSTSLKLLTERLVEIMTFYVKPLVSLHRVVCLGIDLFIEHLHDIKPIKSSLDLQRNSEILYFNVHPQMEKLT